MRYGSGRPLAQASRIRATTNDSERFSASVVFTINALTLPGTTELTLAVSSFSLGMPIGPIGLVRRDKSFFSESSKKCRCLAHMGNVGKNSAHVSAVVSKQTKAFLEAYAREANFSSAGKLVKQILGAWQDGDYYAAKDDAECRVKARAAISGFSGYVQPEAQEKVSLKVPKRRRAS